MTEFFVIATGTSPRQMRTVIDELQDLGKKMNFAAWHVSGYESAKWIVLDCVNVVVHVFDSESRDFYDLELLWGDSPRIDWRKELGLPPAAETPPEPDALDESDEEEAALEHQHDAEGDADVDEDAELDEPVVVERPDESTGSNSVEFMEIDPPSKRGQKGRTKFPAALAEPEDASVEELAMNPLSRISEGVEEADEDAAALAEAEGAVKKAKKRSAGKPAKKEPAKARKPAAKKPAARKPAKKGAAKRAPKRSAARKITKKAAGRKAAGKKKPPSKRK